MEHEWNFQQQSFLREFTDFESPHIAEESLEISVETTFSLQVLNAEKLVN